MITIRTLGPVEVLVNDGPAPAELLWRKHLGLLVYLARSPGRVRSREHLVGLLWGEKPESAARHSLNEALRILRRCCGENGVDASARQVRLNDGAVTIDTAEFEEYATAKDWGAASALVSGQFMEGYSVPGEWAFEEWLSAERRHWIAQSVTALTNHAAALLSAGDAEAAAAAAGWGLRLEPCSEGACRALLSARALLGDRTGALAAWETFVERLREDMGIEPDAETRALAERVRDEPGFRVPGHVEERMARGAESKRAPLVERGAQLSRLVAVWNDCRESRSARVAFLAGEPGSGRTRVLQEVVDRARLGGAVTAVLRAVEGDAAVAWSGVTGLLRSGLATAPGVDRAPPAARSVVGRLLALAGRGTVEVGALEGSPAAALSELLRPVAAEAPVLLAVDDSHWLDVESLGALGALLRDLEDAAVCVIVSVPSNRVVPAIEEMRAHLGRELRGESVRLRPLSGSGIRTLARWALPGFTPVEIDRVARRLATDTAGLPLLAVELLHAIALGLDIDTGPAVWPSPMRTLDQTMPADLPDTITSAIRVGFRRLSPGAQNVLASASILPLRMDTETLARATGLAEPALLAALDELEWERWLSSEPRGYSFVARIVRDVVARDMLTSGRRRRILEAVGRPGSGTEA
jgi:DNA-binding SARP family transcriptional activator